MMTRFLLQICMLLFPLSLSAQIDSASSVIEAYFYATGTTELWQSTFAMEYSGVSTVHNGGFSGDQPNRTRIFTKRVNQKGHSNGKDSYIEDNISKEDFVCVNDTSYQLVTVDPHGVSSFFSIPIYEEDHIAKRSNARFNPQLKLLYGKDSLTQRQYDGRINMQGNTYWLLSFVKGNQKTTWYINTVTGYLEIVEEAPGNYTSFSDYKVFEGRHMPCDMKIHQSGKLIYHESRAEFRFNIALESCEDFLPSRQGHEKDR